MLEVTSVKKDGTILLKNTSGKSTHKIHKDYGHIAHAYCITSHASQGKTVDEVFISQPAATFPATDAKQFYVSVSRGRNGAHIYTDNKQELLQHAERLGDRQSALELMTKKNQTAELAKQHARNTMNKTPIKTPKQPKHDPAKKKETPAPNRIKDKSYEPGI